MDLHRLGERRSIAYHDAIAARMATDAAMLERVRARLAGWEAAGRIHPALARAWRELLELPIRELQDRLREDSPRMAQLRSSSPFAGELPTAQRWELWRKLRSTT